MSPSLAEGIEVIRLGGYGPFPSSTDPRELADAHRKFGYRAAYCPPIALNDRHLITATSEAFAKADVLIAEVPAWRNVVPPESAKRKAGRDYVCDRLMLADEVGALCAVTYIGSMAPESEYEPDPQNLSQSGFDAFVECARYIIDMVKPKRAKFCFEMMQWQLPDSAEILVDLIMAVDRPAFAAHLDPVNLIVSPRQYYDTGSLIRRCFELLGPWIVSAHAKDIALRPQLSLHLDEVPPGQGGLDYGAYLSCLDDAGIPLMLEHLNEGQYAGARDYLKSVGLKMGIPI